MPTIQEQLKKIDGELKETARDLHCNIISVNEGTERLRTSAIELVKSVQKETAEKIEEVFLKYYPPIKCVGKPIKDDGVMQTYRCLHCKNEWTEADTTPDCPLSFDSTAQRTRQEIFLALSSSITNLKETFKQI